MSIALTLPADPATEKLVLGSILLDSEQMHAVRSLLQSDDFSLQSHRDIWVACCDLYDSGKALDKITVIHAMETRGDLERAGGIGYVVSLDDGLPEIVNLVAYVERLKEKAIRRRLMNAAEKLQIRCSQPGEPISEILDSVGQQFAELGTREDNTGPVSAAQLVDRVGLDKLLAPRRDKGLKLPWPSLDSLLCGLHPDQMILVAAHTSFGKTSLALQVAGRVATDGGGVLIFSREMSAEQLFRRMVNQDARVDYASQRAGCLDPEGRRRERQAATRIATDRVWFDETSATVPAMHAAIRRVRAQRPLSLVIVDYLQLMSGFGRPESRAKEVGANSRALKQAAKEFHLPFIVLSQFNRDSAKGERQAELYDLKESGDIENDSDVVILIRPEDPKSDLDVRPCKFFVPKQREGPRNKEVPMLFFSQFQRFEEMTND